jgi:hypothetical protein
MSIIPALRRLRQKDFKFKASLGRRGRPYERGEVTRGREGGEGRKKK